MKWFKHDTNALHDAKIEKLVMKHGIVGYGLYFACVEMIAGTLSPDNVNFELEHDAELLAYKFKIDTLKAEKIMKYCVHLGLFQVSSATGRLMCLKLAERLDTTMSQNPEVRKILAKLPETLSDVKELPETLSDVKQIRLDENRIEEKEICSDSEESPLPPKPNKKKKDTGHKAAGALTREPRNNLEKIEFYFIDLHEKLHGFKPEIDYGKTRSNLKNVLKRHSVETIQKVILQASRDEWIKEKNAFDLVIVLSKNVFNRILREIQGHNARAGPQREKKCPACPEGYVRGTMGSCAWCGLSLMEFGNLEKIAERRELFREQHPEKEVEYKEFYRERHA